VKTAGIAAFAAAKLEGRQVGGCRKMFFLNLQRCGVMRKRADPTTDYFWIFPNWMLNCYPDNISVNIVLRWRGSGRWQSSSGTWRSNTGIRRPGLRWNLATKSRGKMSASRKGAKESAIAELLAGTLQREAGKRGTRVSPDVRGMDERQLVEL